VDPESETETYVAGRFTIEDWRWSGVPFYLRAGKRLPERTTEIAIQFKEVPLPLFRESTGDPAPNVLAMRIQPDEGIMLRFAAKVPGLAWTSGRSTWTSTTAPPFPWTRPTRTRR